MDNATETTTPPEEPQASSEQPDAAPTEAPAEEKPAE
jgi:hypothetical protein